MKNPFVYGEEVIGESFIDRENEIKMFIKDVESNERIFLLSPRRYGKTSLIVNLFNVLLKKKWLTARIDLYKVTSLESFANFYTTSIINSVESKPEKWIRILRQFLPSLSPTLTFTPEGAELSLNLRPPGRNIELVLDELYNLPEKIATKNKKRVAIAFDEFQEVRKLDGEKVEKSLRANIQRHHNVTYIFAGSKKRMLYDMVTKPSSAFYKMGKIVHLNKIPEEEFKKFIITKFLEIEVSFTEDAFQKIFQVTENIPYNIQFLCHQIWDKYVLEKGKKKLTITEIDDAVTDIIYSQSPMYTVIWDKLTLHQRRLLKSIANSGGRNIFSQDFIKHYDLGSAASIQTSVNLLVSHEFLDKENNTYIFTDVFFREWIKK